MKKYSEYKKELDSIILVCDKLKEFLLDEREETEDKDIDVADKIDTYSYRTRIFALVNYVLQFALKDQEINEMVLKMAGYGLYNAFGYEVRLTKEEQINELKKIKEDIAHLIWDFPDTDSSIKLEKAYNNIDYALKNHTGIVV